jgi:hypothetical protein
MEADFSAAQSAQGYSLKMPEKQKGQSLDSISNEEIHLTESCYL